MRTRRVLILGAGLSGLSAAWYLRRTRVPLEIVILEKTARFGGCLHTDQTSGFHFEKGPRALRVGESSAFLQMAFELGLRQDVLNSGVRQHHRYLWHNEELQRFPRSIPAFLVSPLTKGFIRALLTEWKQPAKVGDETVWEFVLRRFNYDVARLFFDPVVTGIFGGDMRKVSVRSCFPLLKSWEERYGSITQGLVQLWRRHGKEDYRELFPGLSPSSLFSFRGGIEQISQALASKVGASIFYEQKVNGLSLGREGVRVDTQRGQFEADMLFCALPARETGLLFQPHYPALSQDLLHMHSQGVVLVSVGYDAPVLPVEGFGYLTSTYSNEDVLAVIFDSSLFPEHNCRRGETRLTIKLHETGKSEEEYVNVALRGIRRHLGISRTPSAIHCTVKPRLIPQYRVGHLDRMQELDQQLKKQCPSCYLVGNYLEGVGVEACVARAKRMADAALLEISQAETVA